MRLEIDIPMNDDKEKHGGWTVDLHWLDKLSEDTNELGDEFYPVGLEETESVVLALIRMMQHENKNA